MRVKIVAVEALAITIVYSVVLALFLGLRLIPQIKRVLTNAESRKNIIMDKDYKPWQRRK